MRTRAPLITSALIIAGMALVSAMTWAKIPAGTPIGVHFDRFGAPDGFAGKAVALVFLPLSGCCLTLLFALLPTLRPRTAITAGATFKRDGKPYAYTGSTVIDALAVTRVNAHEGRSNLMRNGKVVGHIRAVVSKDGKTLTLTRTIRTAAGKTDRDVRVYDRQ